MQLLKCCRRDASAFQRVDEEAGERKPRSDFAVLKLLFTQYIWRGDNIIKLRVVVAFVLLILSKVFNILTPQAYKRAVDNLSGIESDPFFPWVMILLYGASRLASTACDNLRDSVFVHVQQESLRKSALDVFNHLHNLSLRFHVHRQTGGVLRAVERGTQGISFLLSFVLFNIFPTLIELFLVCMVLVSSYTAWFVVIIVVVIGGYVGFTLSVTEWRNKFRRQQNELNNQANNICTDSLLNFETVKYFSNERHEAERYNKALRGYKDAAIKSQTSLAILNIGQSAIISIGLVSVMLLAASENLKGNMTIGDFVLVNTYLLQLYIPLNFLGTSYRMIKQSLVDLENMFALLDEQQEVKDDPDAEDLVITEGRVDFKNVFFSYDNKVPVLNDVSFTIPAGHRVALVGPTGSGKSARSLIVAFLWFYDVTGGKILIDGHDITTVTQHSLRKQIGVVPQDTVLFNDSIGYNIRYGRVNATDEEVREAARMAKLDEFIERLPEKYETKVGERGLRLSGGERGRLAIARAILKNPKILIEDESTAAMDTITEKEIQKSLREVSKGRTSLVIAHRLSTIVDADQILVLKNGSIIERGTHEELLEMRGEYYRMWMQQTKEEQNKQEHSAASAGAAAAADSVDSLL